MRASTLNFIGIRKHFWKETIYNINLYDDCIEMMEIKSTNPKYVLPLKLSTVIEIIGQVHQNNRNFSGFIFKYKDTTKLMNCRTQDIALLIDILSNKVTFLNINLFYQAVEIIGRGSSASVSVLIDIFTQQQYAVKSIDKQYLQSNDKKMILFENEVKILQELTRYNHLRFFIHLYRVFESKSSYYLILDLMKGKSLTAYYNKIRKKSDLKLLSSETIKLIMKRLLSGVQLLHYHRIIHRDLKPDNLLFAEQNNVESLVIADFGLATSLDVEQFSYPVCGTQGFMAPEITHYKDGQIKYDEKIDIYSVGIIFNWLLTGDIDKHNSHIQKLDQITINLLHNLLRNNPKERLSAQSALEHPYFGNDEITKKTLQTSYYGFENVEDCETIVQHEDVKNYSLPALKKPQR